MRVLRPSVFASALLVLAAWTQSTVDAGINGNERLYGINYNSRKGPDWAPDAQRCKSDGEVQNDMYQLRTVADRVRIYSLRDCNQPWQVLPFAKKAGLKVALGIWTTTNDADFNAEKQQLGWLIDAGHVDGNVVGLHVGSEAIYREELTAGQAIKYMQDIKSYLVSRGLGHIPVTIADVVDSYYYNPGLIDAVDVVSINQFSFWEKTDVDEAMHQMLDRLRDLRVRVAAKGKKMLISETGWSSKGKNNASSEATPESQTHFFKDFYHQAKARDLEYYWFVGYESQWRVTSEEHEVEGHFGIFEENGQMKSNFQALQLGTRDQKTIRSSAGLLLAHEEDDAVYLGEESEEWLEQEKQTWLFDSSSQQIRSKYSDLCLDAYEPWNGGTVHVYKCINGEPNQKWQYDPSTGAFYHAGHQGFCLDNDPAQKNKLQLWGCNPGSENQVWMVATPGSAPVGSNTVRFYTKESAKPFAQMVRVGDGVGLGFGAQGAADSEWIYDESTHLIKAKNSEMCLDAYEAWDAGRIHLWQCNAQEPNQQWDFDSATGQFKHRTHAGFCLDADPAGNNGAGLIQLYWCHLNNNNQVFRKVYSNAKAVHIRAGDKSVVEFKDRDTLFGASYTSKDTQAWFWDSVTKHILSKWGGECLDADKAQQNAAVHTWSCNDEGNQVWTYDAAAKRVKHAKHTGFCLAYDSASSKNLVVKSCSSSDATQTFTLDQA
ncbi:hypothetical protein Poli38472_003472 [Pythium oligandrum]|uniref:glucan endo-1,3-beta-D-glucosidase n=1 Tax=Pythium oligandrum TaxID=41045 RepID=A0A8K1C6P3_PYTOL|nr:hypothetical protein Poli38472_003472 [Pythium oligandrum]|eukprot:TMW57547.1 hypothetical protein Poli38472_003472 [Pythium oligandrum]